MTWAILIGGLVALKLLIGEQSLSLRSIAVVLVFLAGSFLGALLARMFTGLVCTATSTPSARFSAMFIGLSCGTVGMTALLHFLHFGLYYLPTHVDAPVIYLLIDVLMTGASAAYIFVVSGMQLLLPWGLPLLFAAAFDYARSGTGLKR
ncbi:hypothetical protein [Roseibium sp.]|uniref:hypothetical protein n=1 Tax=Roseibium sp. TaxID=1936156 RepID=UPI003A96F295